MPEALFLLDKKELLGQGFGLYFIINRAVRAWNHRDIQRPRNTLGIDLASKVFYNLPPRADEDKRPGTHLGPTRKAEIFCKKTIPWVYGSTIRLIGHGKYLVRILITGYAKGPFQTADVILFREGSMQRRLILRCINHHIVKTKLLTSIHYTDGYLAAVRYKYPFLAHNIPFIFARVILDYNVGVNLPDRPLRRKDRRPAKI